MSIELQPSKLGTKEHWDEVYEEELVNWDENGDEGEIWFGEDSLQKMVDWTIEHLPPSVPRKILEVGTGNGTLLFGLHEAGYASSSQVGIDYSAGSVKLAQSIAESKSIGPEITFEQLDFLSSEPSDGGEGAWDLLLDKGTYDAIALMQKASDGAAPVNQYPSRASRLLKPGGFFLITSCNFTEDELKDSFLASEVGFVYQ